MTKAKGTDRDAEQVIAELREALDFFYATERQNRNRSWKWRSWDLEHPYLRSTCLTVKEHLRASSLLRDSEENGHDAADVILFCAYRLGVQVGLEVAEQRAARMLPTLAKALSGASAALVGLDSGCGTTGTGRSR